MKTVILTPFFICFSVLSFATGVCFRSIDRVVPLNSNALISKTIFTKLNTPSYFGVNKTNNAIFFSANEIEFVPNIICAVNFIDFTANENNLGVKLNWETKSEINTSKFELQRSADGLQFETINTQNTKAEGGTSDKVLLYNYTDKTPQYGTIYYRLKTIYKDELKHESDVKMVSVSLDVTNTLIVYPCVVTDELTMRWREINSNKYNLEIYDVTGEKVLSASKLKGQSYTAVVSHLNPGVHILKLKDISTNKLIAVRKFIKK